MKKSELKTGMMIVTRDGDRWMVFKDVDNSEDVLITYDGWNDLKMYDEDLRLLVNHDKSFDIIEVYSLKYVTGLWMFFNKDFSDFKLVSRDKKDRTSLIGLLPGGDRGEGEGFTFENKERADRFRKDRFSR